MKVGLNAHGINQSTMYSTVGTVKNTQSSPSTQGKEAINDSSIKFDIQSLDKEVKNLVSNLLKWIYGKC